MQFNGAIVSTRVEGRKYPFFGYAPGDYLCMCHDCKKQFLGDKRCLTCEPCAEAAYLRADLMQQIELLERCHYGIAVRAAGLFHILPLCHDAFGEGNA